MTTATYELPAPLVKPWRHPLHWLRNLLQTLITMALFATVGGYIVVALYYLLFEVYPPFTHAWHSAISNSYWRHNVRNIGEGLLGGLLAQQIVWNHYKKKVQKRLNAKRSILDKIEISLHIPNVKDGRPFSVWQLLVSPWLALIYAAPGFFVFVKLVDYIHNHNVNSLASSVVAVHPHIVPHLTPHAASFWTKMQHGFSQDWPKKLVGFGAAFFFGRRPVKGVFDDVQLLFAERRVQNNQPLHWYHPPTFKARYNEVKASGAPITVHSTLMKWLVVGSVPVAIALAVFGVYVLAYIA